MRRATKLIFDPEVERRLEQVARAAGDVLIVGPTGSGKSEVARRIHELGLRKGHPFILQNCAAIPKELAESTLFGHERGAFTTADRAARGIVAAADRGTLFLDEIGELPLAVQAKLLTLLQDHTYRPVGSVVEKEADFRLIAATNRDLIELCNQGLFREDLYHRINVLSVALPSLRESPQRAQQIAVAELERLAMPEALGAQALAAVNRLSRHPMAWPGNVRELLSFLRRCVLGVAQEERRLAEEWARWRRSDGTGRLTPFAPTVSPSLGERDRYAGLLHQLAEHGARPKTAVSREVSLELSSRLLDAFPEALALDEVQVILGVRDRRTLSTNVALLENRGLVRRVSGGLVAMWPPATSTLLGRHQGEWIPAGPGTILSLVHGDRVRIELTAKCAGTLGVVIVTHRPTGLSSPDTILEGKELQASKTMPIEVELDGDCGLEQILVHVGPPAARGGKLVEATRAEGIMPDSQALERGRRMVLERWHEGWLTEHLVFHSCGE